MKFLNVGALEFVLILLLAFIVLGPKQAVKTAGDVGRWIKKLMSSQFWRDLVSTSQQIQELPRKMMDDAEIENTLRDLERTNTDINSILVMSGDIENIEPRINEEE
jgi:Sec-independent protein translocase protein TatA